MSRVVSRQQGTQQSLLFQGPVRLGDQIDRIESLILSHCALPDPAIAALLACWIVNTYSYHLFRYCGYLDLRSTEPGCGKSTVLKAVGLVAKGNPKLLTIPTAAVIFRCALDVLLLDEVDNLRHGDPTNRLLLAVLNSGFEAGNRVPRNQGSSGDGYEVQYFDPYGPKAFAGIEGLSDTLTDRTFRIEMQPAPQRLPRLNDRKLDHEATYIRWTLGFWATDTADALIKAYDDLPNELEQLSAYGSRYQDISEPLVVIARQADAERPSVRLYSLDCLRG